MLTPSHPTALHTEDPNGQVPWLWLNGEGAIGFAWISVSRQRCAPSLFAVLVFPSICVDLDGGAITALFV